MEEKLAKDINECDDCPLYHYDCKGWGISAGEEAIEPHCCS